jgi:lipopolysaccharide cholinephosphotransferase
MKKVINKGLKYYAYDNMRQAQDLQLKLLKIAHNICKNNGLQYWLDAGSMLGAVRHNGFIPWDDDLDICLLKPDYDKLLPLLDEKCKEDKSLFLKFYNNKDSCSFIEYFCSTEIVLEEVNGTLSPCHIDIFPMKLLENSIEAKKLDNITTDRAMYFTHGSYRYENGQLPDLIKDKKNAVELKQEFFSFYNENFMNLNYYKTDYSNLLLAYSYGSILKKPEFDYFNYNDVFPLILKKFDGFETFVPHNYNAYLEKLYGNYMQFPRVDQRVPINVCAHHVSKEKRQKVKIDYLKKVAVFNISYYFIRSEVSKITMLIYYMKNLGFITTLKGLKITRKLKRIANKPIFKRVFIES